jgi:hypothetical protein
MDLRYDLATIWSDQDLMNKKGKDQIFVKLVLLDGTQDECATYLTKRGITASWLFPLREQRRVSGQVGGGLLPYVVIGDKGFGKVIKAEGFSVINPQEMSVEQVKAYLASLV